MEALFFTRRSAALLLLGLAGGIPYAVATVTVQGALTSAGASEAVIGDFAVLLLPYTAKVLWSPIVDAVVPPGLRMMGRRRAWMALAQGLVLASLLGTGLLFLSMQGRTIESLIPLLFGAMLLLTIASATQDVAADAYRIDVTPAPERAAAASVFVMGYRIALALLGAGTLIAGEVASRHFGPAIGWAMTFAALAAVMALASLGTRIAPIPVNDVPSSAPLGERLRSTVREPFLDFMQRYGTRLPLLLLLIFLFKLPDNLALPMTLPFLKKHLGYSLETIGWVRQALGVGVTIGGALLGAVIVPRLGMTRSLLLFGVVQATSTASFAWLAWHAAAVAPSAPGTLALAGAVIVEYLGVGLVTAGFVAFLMSLCDPRHSATQYALLTAVMTLGVALAGAASGRLFEWLLAHANGQATTAWIRFFLICVASGVLGLAIVPFVTRERAARTSSSC